MSASSTRALFQDAHGDLARVLEDHAAERHEWANWGQTLRSEATSLEGDHVGTPFTDSFLQSNALQRIFESVCRERMTIDDKHNLLFIMKNCMLNSTRKRRRHHSHGSPSSQRVLDSSAVAEEARMSDFVEQLCARLVKLGELFTRVAAHQSTWLAEAVASLSDADETREGIRRVEDIDASLTSLRQRTIEAVCAALCAIKLRNTAPSHTFSSSSENLLYAAVGEQSAVAQGLDASATTTAGMSRHMSSCSGVSVPPPLSSLLTQAFQSSSEPRCSDVFLQPGASVAYGVFATPTAAVDSSATSEFLLTLPSALSGDPPRTTTTSSSAASTFASPLPAILPLKLAEHDSWAQFACFRAARKVNDAARELFNYLQQREYDEEVRFELDEHRNNIVRITDELHTVLHSTEVYQMELSGYRDSLLETLRRTVEQYEAKIREESESQELLKKRLMRLEEEARKVRVEMEVSKQRMQQKRKELTSAVEQIGSKTKSMEIRMAAAATTKSEVESQCKVVSAAKLFVDGLRQRSSEQTTLHLKLQEEIIQQQSTFSLQQVDEAVRRVGVVVAMLDTGRSHIKDAVITAHNGATDATGLDNQGATTARLLSVSASIRSMYDDLASAINARVECCKDVFARLEALFSELRAKGFDMPEQPLGGMRSLVDAIEWAAAPVPQSTISQGEQTSFFAPSNGSLDGATFGNTTLNTCSSNSPCSGVLATSGDAAPTWSPQSAGMPLRSFSSTEVCDAAYLNASTTQLERTENCTKRKSGVPLKIRRSGGATKAGSSAAAARVGVAAAPPENSEGPFLAECDESTIPGKLLALLDELTRFQQCTRLSI